MTKEQQDLAWTVLPKEFKEEVKKLWQSADKEQQLPHDAILRGEYSILVSLFGPHNLTSDAEGEEMLIVSRKKVQEKWQRAYKNESEYAKAEQNSKIYAELYYNRGILSILDTLFGSKCLPDEEPPLKITAAEDCIAMAKEEMGIKDESKPAAPKEEVAKMKPIESKVSVYLATKKEDEEFRMLLHENGFMWNNEYPLINQSNWASDPKDYQIHFVYPDKTVTYSGERTEDTLTFTEFKKRYFGEESRNLSQETVNCDKHFNTIPKDGFAKERRLNIATSAMQGILSNPKLIEMGIYLGSDADRIARFALAHADALMEEADKLKEK